jgi:hypothetical protein
MGKCVSFALLGCLAIAVMTETPRAQSNIAWQTTFNCAEWTQTDGLNDADVCAVGDNITGWGGWSTSSGKIDQITTAANNPSGAGGRGFRHWRGGASSTNLLGQSNNAGGIKIDVPGGHTEIWVRWYMRWQQGFAWQMLQQTKDLYVNSGSTVGTFTLGFHSTDNFGVSIVQPSSQNLHGSPGWQSTMGGAVGDGRWHSYEYHVKTTSPTVAESWIDGRLVHRHTGVNFGGVSINYFGVGSNQCCVAVQPDMYTDYDDFAISYSGYIGPIGGAVSPTPAAPANLRITL